MIEEKETITFKEFRAWVSGLILGKGGEIPDLEDWKKIKKMMDKVVEREPVFVDPTPHPRPNQPFGPVPNPMTPSRYVDFWYDDQSGRYGYGYGGFNKVTCEDTSQIMNGDPEPDILSNIEKDEDQEFYEKAFNVFLNAAN